MYLVIFQIFGFASVTYGMIESARYYKGPKYFYHYDYLHTLPFVRVFEKTMKWYHKEKTGKYVFFSGARKTLFK